jgi:hypothetical protein
MKEAETSDWKIDLEYKKKLKLEDAKFIFEQAEKSFGDTSETSKKILDRSSSLLTLISSILIGLVAYSISKWEKTQCFDAILITAILAIVYFFLLGLIYIFPNIRPTEYILPGAQPKKYFVDALFNATPPTDGGRLLLLYMIGIKNLQQGITENKATNDKRWLLYKKSLNLIFYSPVIIILLYLIIDLFIK